MRIWFFFIALWVIGTLAAEIQLPGARGAEMPAKKGTTWQHYGTMDLTYAAAKKKLGFLLSKQGWVKLQSFDIDRIQWKSLEIWKRSKERILVQFWREEVSRTGFAWGILKDETRP